MSNEDSISEDAVSMDFGVAGPAKLDNSEQERTRRRPPVSNQSGRMLTDAQQRAKESAPSSLSANKLGAGTDDRGMDRESRDRYAKMFVRHTHID